MRKRGRERQVSTPLALLAAAALLVLAAGIIQLARYRESDGASAASSSGSPHGALSSRQRGLLGEASRYSLEHAGLSMLVRHGNRVIYESYGPGLDADDAHNLFSGTKSFNCAAAVAAEMDGLLDLDEPVADSIPSWRQNPDLARITIRDLLSLSSGLEAGDPVGPAYGGRAPVSYSDAAAQAAMIEPGIPQFDYGAIPFQIFGAVMRTKLGAVSIPEYLDRRVFDAIGLSYAQWPPGVGGDPPLAAGAFLTARDWALFGQLIANDGTWHGIQVLDPKKLAECFEPSATNPLYGLTFWLPTNHGGVNDYGRTDQGAAQLASVGVPDDLVKAAGRGGQKLYIIPSLDLVVVRQADRYSDQGIGFSDAKFLAPVLEAIRSLPTSGRAFARSSR